MTKIYEKNIFIHDETVAGNFPLETYDNCTIIFKNCTLINFEFHSRKNSIVFLDGNVFFEQILLEAKKVEIKSAIDMENLSKIVIDSKDFSMAEGIHMKALEDISISSDIQSFKKNKLESLSSLVLQSSYGTIYQNCQLKGKYGVKITSLKGNLRMEDCKIEATSSSVKEAGDDYLNGIYLSCFGKNTKMHLLRNIVKTDVLEITHPNYTVVHDTDLYKNREYGRFLSRNHELGEVVSHSYIESETILDQFYHLNEEEKKGKSKILELFSTAFKKN